jgi:hypothetical protein
MSFFVDIEYNNLLLFIDKYFPNLIIEQKILLKIKVKELIEFIASNFYFDINKKNMYYKQFQENKGRDIITLILIILPYIKNTDFLPYIYNLQELLSDDLKFTNRQIEFGKEKIDINLYIEKNVEALKKTITIIRHKLYVNWLTVRPISLNKYKNLLYYQDTVQYVKKEIDMPGIYLGDIYHTISYDLFMNIRKVKWLLYEKIINNTLISYEEKLNELFYPDDKFDSIIIKLKNGLMDDFELDVIRYAIVFFENYFLNERDYTNYIKFKSITEDKLEKESDESKSPDNLNLKTLSGQEIGDKLEIINKENWYNYLNEIQRILNSSWFGKKSHILKEMEVSNVKIYLTRKNIYHFGKNMYMKNKSLFEPICRHWEELSDDDKKEISKRFQWDNDSNFFKTWFNISGYLRSIYPRDTLQALINSKISDKPEEVLSYYILNEIYNELSDIIFEILIYKGVLSEYIPNPKAIGSGITAELKDSIKEIMIQEDYEECYYYLTGQQYKNLLEGKYLKNIANNPKENNWISMYALDWLSQINLFHKVYHNRISFVTGGTGVGKSTQVPKLFLYSMIMIHYNSSVSVLCSQPRIPPTVNNAERVGKELGFKIQGKQSEDYNCPPSDIAKKKELIITENNNYYIQFKHSYDEFIPKTKYYGPYLRFLTDGTLKENITSNMLMHTTRKEKENSVITLQNTYDMIIVDEAHEHNVNMDIILSLMKFIMKNNLSVKLAIISATMDFDEGRYRTFFKDINDTIQIPYIESDYRQYIDRRIHVSPFGLKNRYVIKDEYFKLGTKSYQEAELEAINKVLQLCKKKINGEILLFSIGQGEIDSIVKILNKELPNNIIALPFYTKLPESFKKILSNIKQNLIYIKYDRNRLPEILAEFKDNWCLDNLPYPKLVQPYERAVIVSTNLAEASLTLPTLKYVVDMGYNKDNILFIDKGYSALDITEISESSKEQRRGRVGRNDDGEVYYMYRDDARKKKTEYKICNENMYISLLELSQSLPEDSNKLINSYKNAYKPYNKLVEGIINNFFPTFNDLLDFNYTFHVIHPDENRIDRDLLTGYPKDYLSIPKLQYLNEVYNMIPYLKNLLNNKNELKKLFSIKKKISDLTELTVWDTISLIVAFKFDKKIFLKIVYFILTKYIMQYSKLNTNLIDLKIENSYEKKQEIFKIEKNNIWDDVYQFYYIFEESKNDLPDITITSLNSDIDKINICFYFMYPLNLAMLYKNKWVNVFSFQEVEIPDNFPSTYVIYNKAGNNLICNSINLEFIKKIIFPKYGWIENWCKSNFNKKLNF